MRHSSGHVLALPRSSHLVLQILHLHSRRCYLRRVDLRVEGRTLNYVVIYSHWLAIDAVEKCRVMPIHVARPLRLHQMTTFIACVYALLILHR